MLVYKDKHTGDELFTDSYTINLIDGIFYEVQGKVKTEKTGIDDSLIGANPSSEEQCEQAADEAVSGINVVLENRLTSTGFDKKGFNALLKGYFKKALQNSKEEGSIDEEDFKEKSKKHYLDMYGKFDEMEFWLGESMDPDGLIGFSYYTSDTEVKMIFFKFGLRNEKF